MNLFAEATFQNGRNTLPQNVAAVAAQHGLEVLDAEAIREARALAVGLIGDGVASAQCLIDLQSHFGAAIFGLRQEGALTGLANIDSQDITKTVVLAALGAVVSFIVSVVLKEVVKKLWGYIKRKGKQN